MRCVQIEETAKRLLTREHGVNNVLCGFAISSAPGAIPQFRVLGGFVRVLGVMVSDILQLPIELFEGVATAHLLDFPRSGAIFIAAYVEEVGRLDLDLVEELRDLMVSIKAVANLIMISAAVGRTQGGSITHMSWLLTDAVGNGLLEALQVLVDVALFLQDHFESDSCLVVDFREAEVACAGLKKVVAVQVTQGQTKSSPGSCVKQNIK